MKALRHVFFFYAFYFIVFPLRNFLYSEDPTDLYDTWMSFHDFWLDITSLTAFFAFSVCIQWILRKYHYRGKDKKWFLLIPVAIIGPILLRFFIQEVMGPVVVGFANYHAPYTMLYYLKDNLYYAILFILFGVTYFYVHYGLEQQKKQFELSSLNKQLQTDQLRSQLNGHFLLNTMNGVYALIQMNDQRAATAMESLSGLLQYSVYENRERVRVDEELKKVKDLIAIHSIRQEGPLYLDIDNRIDDHIEIPPFIVLPVIENILKHAVITDIQHKPQVEMQLSSGYVHIVSKNKIARTHKDAIGGIGLDNLKKRLHLMYGDRATLEYFEKDDYFNLVMKIPLTE